MQKGEGGGAGQRLGEEITLHFVAAVAAQQFKLVFRFDTFGDDIQPQRMGEGDGAKGDGAVVEVGLDIADE